MKRLLMAVVIFTAANSLKAQNLSFGPTAGFGHSWTSVETGSADKKFHAAYNIGGKMVYSFVSNWGISGDIKFSSEGVTAGTDADNKTSVRTNYLRVPLQAVYFFNKYGDRIRPKVSLGPSFGFLVGGKIRTYDNGEKVAEVKSKDYAESFDLGITAAAGLNIRINTAIWLNLDLAYYHGFLDVAKSSADSKNRNLGINAGVTFPIGTILASK